MLHLNDDCLYEIFRRATLRDQLALRSVCMRFHDIVELVWGGKFREFHTDQTLIQCKLTRDEYKALFAIIAAERLEKLTIGTLTNPTKSWYGGRNHLAELSFYLSLDYPHVRELHLEEMFLYNNYMQLVGLRFPALQVLHLSGEYFTLSAGHRHLLLLSQIIDVGWFPKYVGVNVRALERQLWRMSNLRTLRIDGPLFYNFKYFFYYFGPSIVEMRFGALRLGHTFPIKSQDAYRLRRMKTLHLDHYIPKSLSETFKEVTSLRELYFSKTAMSIDLAEFIANTTHLEHIRCKSTPCLVSIYLDNFERLFLCWLEQLYKCLKAAKVVRPQPLTVYSYGFHLAQELIQRHRNVIKYKAISAAAALALPQEEERLPYIQFEFSKDGIASHYNNVKATMRALPGPWRNGGSNLK